MRLMTELGGLSCRVLQEGEEKPKACVVLCHGFGAPGDDLVALYPELLELEPRLSGVRFVFPEAPLSLSAFGYPPGSRAWWPIDWEQIQRLSAGDPAALREFRRQEPPGMAQARQSVLKLVNELTAQSGLSVGQLVLGGFSQGAMVTNDVTFRLEEAPRALVTLSGTLLLEDLWRKKAAARAGLRVFQSHGRQDPILRYDAALLLKALYEESGLKVDWHDFQGGHGIPLDVLEALARFLLDAVGG